VKIVIAPDKFKGVQTSREVARNIAAGLRDVLPEAVIEIVPIADGGEGTADVICEARGGLPRQCRAHDALGHPIETRYAWLKESGMAVIEMSEAAGMRRLAANERNVDLATTFGVGEMILDAAKHGAREIVVGLGGSATNDGGLGLARALGFRFFGENDLELKDGPAELATLARIILPGAEAVARLRSGPQLRVVAAADVRNPLLGENGATRIFGPQKGATGAQIEVLEKALTRLADVVTRDLGIDFRDEPGAGAAGGLGFGLLSFCGAIMRRGFEVVAEAVHLEAKIKGADVVITGEGSLDRQTLEGKAPAEVATLARKFGRRVFAVVGRVDDSQAWRDLFDGVYAVAKTGVSDEENTRCAPELLREGARKLAREL
jgi:glycerate kinase